VYNTQGSHMATFPPGAAPRPWRSASNQLARGIIDATGEQLDTDEPKKDPAAVALWRRDGHEGGKARSFSPEKGPKLPKCAAQCRWRVIKAQMSA
jgi:hypothetical protein